MLEEAENFRMINSSGASISQTVISGTAPSDGPQHEREGLKLTTRSHAIEGAARALVFAGAHVRAYIWIYTRAWMGCIVPAL